MTVLSCDLKNEQNVHFSKKCWKRQHLYIKHIMHNLNIKFHILSYYYNDFLFHLDIWSRFG